MPCALQRSCELFARNSAYIFNHRIQYLPRLRPSRKRDFQSLPLNAPRAPQGSFGLSTGNSASIFNRRIEYSPCLRPSRKRDFKSLHLDVLCALQGSCSLSRRTLAATFNRRTEYFHRLRRIAKRTFKVYPLMYRVLIENHSDCSGEPWPLLSKSVRHPLGRQCRAIFFFYIPFAIAHQRCVE